jgi:hypothetical protein
MPLRLRRGETSPILWDVFIDKAQSLNPGTVEHLKAEEIANCLIRVAPTIKGNLQSWDSGSLPVRKILKK